MSKDGGGVGGAGNGNVSSPKLYRKLPESPFKLTQEKFDNLDKYSESLEDEVIRLRSENQRQAKELLHLSEEMTERIQRSLNDKQLILTTNARVESAEAQIDHLNKLVEKLAKSEFELKKELNDSKHQERATYQQKCQLKSEIDRLNQELEASRQAAECFKNFLKLGKE